mmetsp:Transcript_50498/g.113458  ORF Transcript_50498/g.113458 Transcript_50498/m.113458 type:complete len:216 (+) Transcript_50498:899-1546(+)
MLQLTHQAQGRYQLPAPNRSDPPCRLHQHRRNRTAVPVAQLQSSISTQRSIPRSQSTSVGDGAVRPGSVAPVQGGIDALQLSTLIAGRAQEPARHSRAGSPSRLGYYRVFHASRFRPARGSTLQRPSDPAWRSPHETVVGAALPPAAVPRHQAGADAVAAGPQRQVRLRSLWSWMPRCPWLLALSLSLSLSLSHSLSLSPVRAKHGMRDQKAHRL